MLEQIYDYQFHLLGPCPPSTNKRIAGLAASRLRGNRKFIACMAVKPDSLTVVQLLTFMVKSALLWLVDLLHLWIKATAFIVNIAFMIGTTFMIHIIFTGDTTAVVYTPP